eukprot:4886486-Prymnesium_polylepis.2
MATVCVMRLRPQVLRPRSFCPAPTPSSVSRGAARTLLDGGRLRSYLLAVHRLPDGQRGAGESAVRHRRGCHSGVGQRLHAAVHCASPRPPGAGGDAVQQARAPMSTSRRSTDNGVIPLLVAIRSVARTNGDLATVSTLSSYGGQ